MRLPTFSMLDEARKEGCLCQSYALTLHPNPRFYKYVWWVFSKYSTAEGQEFFSEANRLTTAAAMRLLERLKAENEPCVLYNARLPRAGSIFDPTAEKWQSVEWAPAYEEDKDESWNGHK
jgi:hypothetical protein